MVITLELAIRQPARENPLATYASRFGALPAWFAEISPSIARALARQALRAGVPLTAADHLS